MQTDIETGSTTPHLQQIATVLRIVGWTSFVLQIGLAAAASVMLLFAASGRTFNQLL